MKRWLTILALAAAAAAAAAPAPAAGLDAPEGMVLTNARMARELRGRAVRLGAAASSTDTTWVGFTPGYQSPANPWSIRAGFGKDGYYRPVNGVPHRGTWDFETPVGGDSLQGWWPLINLYGSTGGQTRTDRNRPWWALDLGNMANYVINQANGRTFGVVGVWHRDGGSLQPAPAGLPSPAWTPAQGGFSAWMGLRAHGDATVADPETGNPFNEDVLMFTLFGSISSGGSDNGFPGYGSQMDQMLYRDIDLSAAAGQDLTVRFQFRTVLVTGVNITGSTRTGWFDSDPLGVTSGPTNPQPNNFISSSDAGDALAPRDSFMVYFGAGIEGEDWLPAASSFGQNLPARPVHDPRRRWFGEVLRWDRDPNGPPASPQPRFYRQLLSVGGNWPADTGRAGWVDTSFTLSAATLAALLDGESHPRLVFRVKTNRGHDDQAGGIHSGRRGAAVVDVVTYRIGSGPVVVLGDFESPASIDNDPAVSAFQAWKSTGKPPGIFFHAHPLADLVYEDLCGQKGDVSRQCNMSGVVISAGDHDAGEAAGGLVDGTAWRERNDGIMSPTIQLAGPFTHPGGTNLMGFLPAGSGAGDVDATRDLYIHYDVYAGVMEPFTRGNLWRYAAMSYPAVSKSSHGSYRTWGNMRFPPFIVFNPDPECLIDIQPLEQQGLIRTSNPNGIPDSLRIFVGKTQQCFRFGVSAGCSGTDGAYFDNIALALVDGDPAPLSVELWNWINDAFPANETPGLPGTAAFDTAAAHLMTGLNIAQSTSNALRFDVPGDSVVVTGSTTTARVDLVFRILPGPGNYEPVGRPDLGSIVRRPDGRALVTQGDGSFWDVYRQNPGDFATPGAVALHHNALGGWDPNVWNSARCDTAEINLFPRQSQGLIVLVEGMWMATYHESDPRFATLGIVKNRCFITGPTDPPTSVVCNGTVPSYIATRPEHADVTGTTREFTKILPDGQLTPGAHVEYFFRAQDQTAPGAASGVLPDTQVVIQVGEGSTDGHRWQQFGVLPNAWKKTGYFHPVARAFGTGPACLLVVDNADRRGNEHVWVGVADTIGATPQRWWGAHNGWHAVGGGDVDDPADNRRGDGQPGFVAEHLGQPGSGGTWDLYQVKASESLTTAAGSLGSRLANRSGTAGQQMVIAKSSRQGPTPEMLNAAYTFILHLTGDLSTGVLGPYSNRSQNDVGILMHWLDAGSPSTQSRAYWAMGDGFAESNVFGSAIAADFMLDYLGADLLHSSYARYSGVTDELIALRVHPGWQNQAPGQTAVLGMRHLCLWTNDVIVPGGVGLPSLATTASEYDRRSAPFTAVGPASVFKDWASSSPYKTLVDGWNIENLTHPSDQRTVDRAGYFYQVFSNVWSKLCMVQGLTCSGPPGLAFAPMCSDVPGGDAAAADFLSLRNNPVRSGRAGVAFGLARADRVEVRIFDVGGRLVRTLADRRFPAGEHELTWDGLDDAGHVAARGVYFTRVRYREGGFLGQRKVVVLR